MTMCSQCHKRVAVVFMTRVENGEKTTRGFCMKCAKEFGVPIDNIVGNVIDQLGISPEQLESAENDLGEMLGQALKPSDCDDPADGGAPAIDFPKLFRDAGLVPPDASRPADGAPGEKAKPERDAVCAGREARQHCRSGSGACPRDSDSLPPTEEQSLPDRGARCGKDRNRRGACHPCDRRKRALQAAREGNLPGRHDCAGCRNAVPRAV